MERKKIEWGKIEKISEKDLNDKEKIILINGKKILEEDHKLLLDLALY